MLKWFGDYTSRHVLGKTNDQLYLKCVSLALCILWYSFVLVGVGVLNMGISISKFACFPTAAFPVRLKQPWRSTSAWEGSTVRVFSSQQPGQNALRDKVCNFYVATLGWLGKAMKDKWKDFLLRRKAITSIIHFLELLHQSKRCDHCMNALCFSVQMQEDYIGRPSRLARRVSSRTTSLRVIQRTFLAVRNSLGAEIAQGWWSGLVV